MKISDAIGPAGFFSQSVSAADGTEFWEESSSKVCKETKTLDESESGGGEGGRGGGRTNRLQAKRKFRFALPFP